MPILRTSLTAFLSILQLFISFTLFDIRLTMKLRYLSLLATLVPLGAAQSPEFLEYHSLCSGEETEGTRTFDNGVTSEYTCRIKASGNINRQETMESAEECAAKCGEGCPGAVWEYTKNNCIIYDSPVTLTPHGRGSIYLKPIQGAQDNGEESSSTSECLHEKQACEDELTHQLGISSRCQSEKEALALESQQCQERNDDLDAQSKTCQRERDGISTKLQDCNWQKDGLETENKSCKREKDELDTKSKTCQREKDELDTKSKTCQREKDELDTKSKTCQREKDELDSNWKAKYEKEVNGKSFTYFPLEDIYMNLKLNISQVFP
jgi:hypothetical protein